ncbi:hypothetical protein CJ030_MR3G001238 [Morella rubra]|uniref:Uncharacterized protein n=1 Tax=Morella rubra TaxID=262757 RepID=A0A6A1W216_9ROSI|nr:hypothetical protein CJ030_MR3G001238 [Morella rubra]
MSHSASELGGPELAELGGHSFDVGGPSFEVGGPSSRSYEDTEAADLEAEDEGLDGLFVTPLPSPNGKDDGVEAGKDDGYMSDMIPSTLLVSPPHSDDDVAGPSRCAPEFVERDLGANGDQKYMMNLHCNLPQVHIALHTAFRYHTYVVKRLHHNLPASRLVYLLQEADDYHSYCLGIVEVNDNAVAAVRVSRKKACRAETPYKEAPAAESLQMHPARKNPPSTRSIVAATGIASRIRMRTSSRLQKFGSQGGSQSTPVVIDLTASKAGAGVRCSWGPPSRGGVQFRVSQPPLGSGAADNDKAPLTKSKGVKDKGKKPRWQI